MPRRCPLCSLENARRVFTKLGIAYWECGSCRFRFSTPASNRNLANTLDEFEDSYLQYLERDPADEKNFTALCRWIERFHPLSGAELLDVGCGSGKFVRYLRGKHVSASGLEPSRALYDHFLADQPYFSGEYLHQFCKRDARRFDIITALDVLEHDPDPRTFLEDLASLVKRDGVILISTPDVGSVPALLLGKHWHFYSPYHLSYFSESTLAEVAGDCGLMLAHVSRRGRLRSVGYVVRYAFEFIFRIRVPRLVKLFDPVYAPINLFDTMYACLGRAVQPQAARDAGRRDGRRRQEPAPSRAS